MIYLLKEFRFVYRNRTLNVPRNLVITGTVLSWYLGIVYYNGDLIYTTFNVIPHGIPYLALAWIYGNKKHATAVKNGNRITNLERIINRNAGAVLFLGKVCVLAYVEQGFWDGLVWREHGQVFSFFSRLPQVEKNLLLAILVPLLALPQITHYGLDGFIWKVFRDNTLKH